MKFFKFYAWEKCLLERIKGVRNEEIKLRYKLANINAGTIAIGLGGISLTIFMTFWVQLNWDQRPATIGQKYMVIIIYLSNHLQIVHMNTVAILMTLVIKSAFSRITEILLLPEIHKIDLKKPKKHSIKLTTASFAVKPEKSNIYNFTESGLNDDQVFTPLLHHITFSLKKSKLMIVIGSVGSGKSTLLQAIQQELHLTEGKFFMDGLISYVSEVPWIISGTVIENVLMGADFDSNKYKKIIAACALDKDIEGFVDKDQTLVGERGVTLSGGQKSRLNLVRALYREFDILLLDDPLSALDSNVCNHVFNNCILDCKTQGKTVILVTHQLQFLDQADKVLLLTNQTVEFYGKPQKLKSHKEVVEQIKKKEVQAEFEPKNEFSVNEVAGIGLDSEEMTETLKFSSVYKYFIGGFHSWIFIAIGVLILVGTQIVLQEFIYWSSHRNDLGNVSDEYFIRGLGFWTLALYCSIFICMFFLSNFYVRCNHKLFNNSLTKLITAPLVFFDKNPSGRIINRFQKTLQTVTVF